MNATTGVSTDRFQYSYDRNSNRLSRVNAINSVFSEQYSYDQLNQLTTFSRGSLSESWNLDALGNWTSVTSNNVTQNRTANQQNEVTAVGAQALSFDANGNTLVDDRGQHYTFDAWNRLVKVTSSGGTTLATYSYDALGRRIVENEGGVARDLYYSAAWQVLEERVGGVAKVQYVWSPVYVDALVERDRDVNNNGTWSERLYVQQDANWNVTALVDTSGAVRERYIYDPYGQVTVLSGTWATLSGSAYAWNYLHQGGRLDVATGLYNFRNRDYSPTLGRWMRVDPMGFGAGDANVYRYVANGPTSAFDPSGLEGYNWWQWHWHHLLPQEVFTAGFLKEHGLNIDINEAEGGFMLHAKDHIGKDGIHQAGWNKEWNDWVRLQKRERIPITEESIRKQLDAMVTSDKYKGFFARGRKAIEGYCERRARLAAEKAAKVTERLAEKAADAAKKGTKSIAKRVGKRVSKMIPFVGAGVVIISWTDEVKAKGLVAGTVNSVLDALPIVGSIKGGIEIVTGEDFIPDKGKKSLLENEGFWRNNEPYFPGTKIRQGRFSGGKQ